MRALTVNTSAFASCCFGLLMFGALSAFHPAFGVEPPFGRQLEGLRLSVSATASNKTAIQVTIENVGREQRLLGLGWLDDGTVSPEYLGVFVDQNDGTSFSVAKPTTIPTRPDPVAVPLPPGGRYEFTLSLEKYQVFSRDRRVQLLRYLSDQRSSGIQVQLKLRTPYCRDAGSVSPDASGCWKGTLISNDLRFPI